MRLPTRAPRSAQAALVLVLVLTLPLALGACGDSSEPNDPPDDPPDDAGEPPVAGCRDGELAGHGLYRLCFPAQWNGKLLVYAHGYVAPDAPLAVPDDVIGGRPLSAIVTGLGYAFAAPSYRANGLVAVEAVEDVAALTEEVRRVVRPDPARTYLVGASEGALVAALAAERRPELLDGVLALCGPVGDFRRQLEHFGDFRVVFDYFFPGVLPGTVAEVPAEARERWEDTYVPAIGAALQGDPDRAAQLFAVTGAAFDAADPATQVASAVAILRYSVFAGPDAQARLGGLPYDNTTRVYTGSADDAALNAGVGRFAAAPAALAAIEAQFRTDGRPGSPIALLHTTGDPVVPVEQQRLYVDEIQAADPAPLVAATEIARYGHCTFTGPEVLDAFAALVERVEGPATTRYAAASSRSEAMSITNR